MAKDGKKAKVGLVVAGLVTTALILITKAAKAAPPIPPADIRLSDLAINPPEVNPGQKVTISATVTNIGGERGSYQVTLGGDFMATKSVTLNPGESKAVSFQVTPAELGVYSVNVDGLTGSFSVVAVPVADIRLSELVIEPREVNIGGTVTITVVATNYGAAAGLRTITCLVT